MTYIDGKWEEEFFLEILGLSEAERYEGLIREGRILLAVPSSKEPELSPR